MRTFSLFILLLLSFTLMSYDVQDDYVWHDLTVTATAYNSVESQTNSKPRITAFGDSLKPGIKVIAVSSDLYAKGLKYNTPVRIKGLEGVYYVKDRMPARWKNKIDIYMGTDVKAAKAWGRRTVSIAYGELIDE
ncbi:3D domain-containing protein [Aestuariibaculum sp. M13]|uniref:3D domain-containing protein n=1 Tax=Aestuariibaculum sp. M13 TaxID=2967132 RepID=UPI002159E6A9|nr:3D domain-containing protein [Aestuariibaculum sp. M13]MCR8667713.1 3D domain-containing protein [Aestuariibaculum sp. M13]